MNILKRNKKKPNISSASMSDIAFLLIIFFMLTTVFALEQGISYQMPESTVKSFEHDKAPIDILIRNNGTYVYKDYGTVTLLRAKELASTRLAVYSEVQAVLRVEEDVKYVHIIDMIDTLLGAGVKKVIFISADDYPDNFSKY